MTKPYSVAFEQKVIPRLTSWGCAERFAIIPRERRATVEPIANLPTQRGLGGVELALGGGREVAFLDHGHEQRRCLNSMQRCYRVVQYRSPSRSLRA